MTRKILETTQVPEKSRRTAQTARSNTIDVKGIVIGCNSNKDVGFPIVSVGVIRLTGRGGNWTMKKLTDGTDNKRREREKING